MKMVPPVNHATMGGNSWQLEMIGNYFFGLLQHTCAEILNCEQSR